MNETVPLSQDEWLLLFSHTSSLLHVPPKRTSSLPDLDALATAQLIDHTLLDPSATPDQISALCAEAREHHFRAVCVRPNYVAHAKKELSGSDVRVASVIGFPSDDSAPLITGEQKATEAKAAVADGATELDMVLNYQALRDAAQTTDDTEISIYTRVYEDVLAVRKAVPQVILLKVILETSQLTSEDVTRATVISCKAGADFVKTSTGFRGNGAKVETVELMREVCDICQSEGLARKRVDVKASGGIRTIDDVRKMVSAGAARIGTSAGVSIMNRLKKQDSDHARETTETTTT